VILYAQIAFQSLLLHILKLNRNPHILFGYAVML
jgi:hypothetical protein